jgi:RNA polymerase sigma factor (sigma-70 family)
MTKSLRERLIDALSFMRFNAERYRYSFADQPTGLVQTSARRILATSRDVPTKTTEFRKYANRTVRNATTDKLRSNRVRGEHESKAAIMRDYCRAYAEVAFHNQHEPEAIENAIQITLDENPHLKDAFEPLIYRNFTDKQVANEIGITDSAVRSRWQEARKLIRKRLTE